MKTKPALVFVFLFAALCGAAQTQTKVCFSCPSRIAQLKPEIKDDGNDVVENYNGTYRFIFTHGVKQAFTDEIYKTIEQNRKEEEVVTLTLSPYVKVLILSRKQITATGFIPFDKSYVFEN